MIIVKDKAKNSPLFIPRNTITTITNDNNTNNSGGGNGIDVDELNKYLADYVTEEELKNKNYATITALSDKQDKLVSGDNIKTINGKSILGEGNITIQGEGGNIDLSEYITKTELDNKGYLTSIPSEYITETELNNKGYATTEALNGKQEKLTSGDNIKTINGQSILGKGNITIEGGNGNANIVELTQAEYDALVEKEEGTIYIITDAPAIDTSEFATKTDLSNALGDIETILDNIIGEINGGDDNNPSIFPLNN